MNLDQTGIGKQILQREGMMIVRYWLKTSWLAQNGGSPADQGRVSREALVYGEEEWRARTS